MKVLVFNLDMLTVVVEKNTQSLNSTLFHKLNKFCFHHRSKIGLDKG